MKLKSLLFGSAAALMAVTGAQAAEPLEPIAEPVDYVRICDAFGTGFFFIPGTDTCLKIGGYVRADFVYNHDWDEVVVAQEVFVDEDGREFIRVSPREDRDYNEFGTRARGRLNFDSRVQTDIGMIRTYIDLWITFGPLNGRGGPVVENPSLGDNFPRQAFIQIANDWGTVTVGRADSFFEFWESDAFGTRALGEDAPISPRNLAAATFNLGGGVSATLSLEDSATDGDARVEFGTGLLFPVDLNEDGIADAVARTGTFAFPTFANGVHGGNRAPDVVANIRVDQAWGSAQIMGAIHPVRAKAFTGPALFQDDGLFPDNEPDTELGWAVGAGAGFDIPGTGVTFNIQGVYADGAVGYATEGTAVSGSAAAPLADAAIVGRFSGTNAAGNCFPTVADPNPCALIGTDIETVEAWSVKAGIGGDLAPDWVFNLQGSYAEVDLPDALGAPLGGGFFGPGPAAVQSVVFTGDGLRPRDPGPVISSDYSFWTASGWVGWAPVSGFITGLELAYEKVEFDAGPEVDIWGGVFRVQKSF